MLRKLLWVLGIAALVVIGIAFSRLGFRQIERMRMLDRVPRTDAIAVIPGEVHLRGVAKPKNGVLVKAPETRTPCLWYRYTVERKQRDSDGKTRWVTIQDRNHGVTFLLDDGTGTIDVKPSARAQFEIAKDHQRVDGNKRYTEYRIEEGDTIFCFGVAEERHSRLRVSFTAPGRYHPLVSEYGEASERADMATRSVLLCWAGLAAISFAVVLSCLQLGLHHTVAYLILITATLAFGLGAFGLEMLERDLRGAHERLEHHRQRALEVIHNELQAAGLPQPADLASLPNVLAGAPEHLRKRLLGIRFSLALATERVRSARNRAPESWLAAAWSIPDETPIPLTSQEHERLLERGVEAPTVHLGWWVWIVLPFASFLGVLLSRWGLQAVREKRLIENLPTSPIAGVVYGLNETTGTVKALDEQTVRAPLTDTPSVWYRYVVQERRGSGKEQKWVIIKNEVGQVPFLCADRTAALRVDATDAEIFTHHVETRTKGNRQYTESRLQDGDRLYVLGYAQPRQPRFHELEMRRGPEEFPYILANTGERHVLQKKAVRGLLLFNTSLVFVMLATLLGFGAFGAFEPTDYLEAALLAPMYLGVLVAVMLYNDLVFLRMRVRSCWSNIDVSLQKRRDLLPQLETLMRSYLKHERELLERIAELKNRYVGSSRLDPIAATALLQFEAGVLENLIGVRERYPELRGDERASELLNALSALENECALMRQGYNQAVERYNTRIEQIPEVAIARLGGFEPAAFFEVELAQRSALPLASAPASQDADAEKAASAPSTPEEAALGDDDKSLSSKPFDPASGEELER